MVVSGSRTSSTSNSSNISVSSNSSLVAFGCGGRLLVVGVAISSSSSSVSGQ